MSSPQSDSSTVLTSPHNTSTSNIRRPTSNGGGGGGGVPRNNRSRLLPLPLTPTPLDTHHLDNKESNTTTPIDESLYSRQLYVFGTAGQRRMQTSKVLITGCFRGGLAAEVLKNLCLAGISEIHLVPYTTSTTTNIDCEHDDDIVRALDLSCNFFLTVADLGSSLSQACARGAGELNPRTTILFPRAAAAHETTTTPTTKYDAIVCVNPPSLAFINDLSTETDGNTPIIVSAAFGLYTYCFSDFGSSGWVSDDCTGETAKTGLIVSYTAPNTFHTEEPHGLEIGSHVRLTSSTLKQFQVTIIALPSTDPAHRFVVATPREDPSHHDFITEFGDDDRVAYFEEIITPKPTTPHVRFQQSVKHPTLLPDPLTWDTARPQRLHHLMLAIYAFKSKHHRLPQPGDVQDAHEVLKFMPVGIDHTIAKQELVRLASVAVGQITPISAFMGGVTAQEVLKACSGKHTPLNQWLHFSAVECLPATMPLPADMPKLSALYAVTTKTNTRPTIGQEAIFGQSFQAHLSQQHVFLVGAGALGCETLKNLILMGICHTTITDPDSIETSNLNRQFLFRESHVGMNKADTARQAVTRLLPTPQQQQHLLKAHALRVETDGVFNDEFWDDMDVVVNALDNLPARYFVDSKCVYYGLPLLESGTLGTKANTMTIIPHMSESYGSDTVKDPGAHQQDIPACTLHAYPNVFEHALTWSRDAVFEKEFTLNPTEASGFVSYLTSHRIADYKTELLKQPNSAMERIVAARRVLGATLSQDEAEEGLYPYACPPITSLLDCSHRARLMFEQFFSNKIVQLLTLHPVNEKSNDGQMFWSGKKRAPKPAVFDVHDDKHMLFWKSATILLARIHGLQATEDDLQRVCGMSNTVSSTLLEFVPDAKIAARHVPLEPGKQQQQQQSSAPVPTTTLSTSIDVELGRLRTATANGKTFVHVERFDKDDDVHIDLIWTAACIRADSYSIPCKERLEAKRVVGRIVPAIATTTAAATGLVALELYKVVQHLQKIGPPKSLGDFRGYNFNLAVNSYTAFEPQPCVQTNTRFGMHNIWQMITLKGDLTVGEVIDYFQEKYQYTVTSLGTEGDVNLFNDVFTPTTVLKDKISTLYERVLGKKPKFFIPLVLDGDVDDDDDQEQDASPPPLPQCRLKWKEGL